MSDRAIQRLFAAYSHQLEQTKQPLKNKKAIHALTHCRTREMGSSFYRCEDNHPAIEQFHSCRNRSCYLCAQQKRLEWIEQQKARVLNVPHFHVIFTVPHDYLPLWRYNEALFSRLLFKASQETLLALLADKKHGGLTPGILMVLHTWGRRLNLHPHTHCLVSAGGLDKSGAWRDLGHFLLPSRVMRATYRGKIQSQLKEALTSGELQLPPDWTASTFWKTYRSLYKKEWHVRVQSRYEHGKGVVIYLARYCKGGPLHPKQLKRLSSTAIDMSYFDHRSQRIKHQQLNPMAFIRRLLQHVPPKGLHTSRHYGLYASAAKKRLAICHRLKDNLSGVSSGHGQKIMAMVLYCKTCGDEARLTHQLWPSWQKGISINREASTSGAESCVQQDDEVGFKKREIVDTS